MTVELSPLAAALQAQHSSRERTLISVPEWQDTPCNGELYSTPYTIKDDQALASYVANNDSAGFVEVLLRKCELADGSRAFSRADKPVLIRTADAAVIKRIASEVMASLQVEDAEGN